MSDYSKSPLNFLLANQQKGYVGLHIEQGVPLLDRDLNLLHDLITATVRSVVTRHIGNGIATGADGFAIQAMPAGQQSQDFRIAAAAAGPGTCLVGGIEVVIPAGGTTYKAQAGLPALTTPSAAQPDPRVDIAYLDVFLDEVDGTADPELNNSFDVGMQTSVRIKPGWVVRVAEGIPPPTAPAGHVFYPLAQLQRPRGSDTIDQRMITDLRQTRLTVSEMAQRLALLEQLLLKPEFAPPGSQFSRPFGGPGASIILFGSHLDLGTVSVRFGMTVATIVGSPTPSQITVTVPSASPGPVKITVQTGGGSVTSHDDFLVLPPPPDFAASPHQFNPTKGPATTTNVTLFGSNFNFGPVSVRFGATVAVIVGTPTATQIVATVPAIAAGLVKITVQNPGGFKTSDDSFEVT